MNKHSGGITTYSHVKTARAKKRKALQNLKDNRACDRCKIFYPHYVLEWHHRDRSTKSFNISLVVRNNISWSRILEEIKKCDLLCSNCHAIVEWELASVAQGLEHRSDTAGVGGSIPS
jgi:hypothetical protein